MRCCRSKLRCPLLGSRICPSPHRPLSFPTPLVKRKIRFCELCTLWRLSRAYNSQDTPDKAFLTCQCGLLLTQLTSAARVASFLLLVSMDRFDELAAPRFNINDVVIHEKERVFQKHFAVDLYRVSYKKFNGGTTRILDREIFERDADAVAILPFDPVSEEVVLIEQFRPGALKDKVSPWLIEIVAGMIDQGETELQAAVRELQEESGLAVTEQDLHYINAVYPSPGGCSEKVTLYVGKITASHLLSHGGVEEESEDIRIFKVPAKKAFEFCKTGRINNAAALIALQYLEINYDKVRQLFLGQASEV